MNLIVLFNPMEYVGALIDPRTWVVAAVAAFAWRPFMWLRRLLLALVVYLLLTAVMEMSLGTFFGPVLYSQFVLGLIATTFWFAAFQLARRPFANQR
jgi:hypothetical protein